MSPSEPPVSIYGTLPRGAKPVARTSDSPLSTHYATFRKERLGPRVSLKMMQMMGEGGTKADDTRSIISGFTEGSGEQVRQGISFNRVPVVLHRTEVEEATEDTVEERMNTNMGLTAPCAMHGGWR